MPNLNLCFGRTQLSRRLSSALCRGAAPWHALFIICSGTTVTSLLCSDTTFSIYIFILEGWYLKEMWPDRKHKSSSSRDSRPDSSQHFARSTEVRTLSFVDLLNNVVNTRVLPAETVGQRALNILPGSTKVRTMSFVCLLNNVVNTRVLPA